MKSVLFFGSLMVLVTRLTNATPIYYDPSNYPYVDQYYSPAIVQSYYPSNGLSYNPLADSSDSSNQVSHLANYPTPEPSVDSTYYPSLNQYDPSSLYYIPDKSSSDSSISQKTKFPVVSSNYQNLDPTYDASKFANYQSNSNVPYYPLPKPNSDNVPANPINYKYDDQIDVDPYDFYYPYSSQPIVIYAKEIRIEKMRQ